MDGLTSQNMMPVDGEGLPEKALEKRWCLSPFLKPRRVEMDDLGVYSKHSMQQMKMILTLPFRFID